MIIIVRIGILTCSNATHELGCSSVSCLADLRKRKGAFAQHPAEERLDLIGIISCPGCPTVLGPDKLLLRIKALAEFNVHAIHLSNCIIALCPFKDKYLEALKSTYPEINIVAGTHEENITREEFREKVRNLFCQPHKNMIDVILGQD